MAVMALAKNTGAKTVITNGKWSNMASKPLYSQFKLDHCLACGANYQLDIAHVLTQGAWPEFKNEIWNCATLTRRLHIEQGQIGLVKFAEKYPSYRKWLDEMGWYVCELTGKFRNEKMNIRDEL